MTDSDARRADNGGDPTIPINPDAGNAPTQQFPIAEETLVDPAGRGGLWSADSGLELSAPGYGETYSGQAPAPQTNYVQPQVWPQPSPPAPPTQGFAEPPRPVDAFGAQNIYQGYPTAPAPQQSAWPAVINDPVGYDYGYSTPANPPEHPNAVLSMVLGIIGVLFFQLLSPVAWYLAAKGRREMAASPGRWRPSGSLTAGFVLGIIGTVFLALGAMFLLVMFVGLIAMAAP